jgi:D-serine deaminase-like pyridoxal phosphate-dependent protein
MSAEWERFRRALAGEDLPAALIDLDALEANAAAILGRGRPVRIASKSVRCPAILRCLLAMPGTAGLMTWSAEETALLAAQGFDDLLLAYPVARAGDAARIARLTADGKTVRAVVDDPAHVALLAAAHTGGAPIRVCLDVDASWRPAGAHLGVRRSPIRDTAGAVAIGRAVRATEGRVVLDAVMAYEAQVAGMADVHPGSRWLDPARRWIKARSIPAVAALRKAVVGALTDDGHAIAVVNGGGTGSLDSTSVDPTVTEVTAGSGFYAPHLFDGYDALTLRPAALFALPVVRRSDPGFVTCAGGGWPASGEIGADRAPKVHLPPGLTPLGLEGWGEVQTPFLVSAGAPPLAIGDPVLARHAKAGELLEHFTEVLLLRGDAVVDRTPTLRGLASRSG